MTANQIIGLNLARARRLRGWTQEEAARHLEPHLGKRWSAASWSAAERSVDSARVREFTADEIVAFSRAFSLPIGWWFANDQPCGDCTPYHELRAVVVADGVARPLSRDNDSRPCACGAGTMVSFLP